MMLGLYVRIENELSERSERGAALVEYGFLLLLVALAAVVILATFGDSIAAIFTDANTELNTNSAAAAPHLPPPKTTS